MHLSRFLILTLTIAVTACDAPPVDPPVDTSMSTGCTSGGAGFGDVCVASCGPDLFCVAHPENAGLSMCASPCETKGSACGAQAQGCEALPGVCHAVPGGPLLCFPVLDQGPS